LIEAAEPVERIWERDPTVWTGHRLEPFEERGRPVARIRLEEIA